MGVGNGRDAKPHAARPRPAVRAYAAGAKTTPNLMIMSTRLPVTLADAALARARWRHEAAGDAHAV